MLAFSSRLKTGKSGHKRPLGGGHMESSNVEEDCGISDDTYVFVCSEAQSNELGHRMDGREGTDIFPCTH